MKSITKSLVTLLVANTLFAAFSAVSAYANPTILLQTTKGPITIELEPKDAPLSCANFLHLVKTHFYDGIKFHRVADLGGPGQGHIVQVGDPASRKMTSAQVIADSQTQFPTLGSGGTAPVKGEFPQNGVNNPLTHDAGAVAMARTNDPNSGSCQFYICTQPCHFLDGSYAVFGKVTKGLANASKIEVGDTITKATVVSK